MTKKEKENYYNNVEIIDNFVNLLSKKENNHFIPIALRKIYQETKKHRKQLTTDNLDIQEIKNIEMVEINDFCDTIREYGHIYHYPVEKLDAPFKKIMEGIDDVQELMNESWGM